MEEHHEASRGLWGAPVWGDRGGGEEEGRVFLFFLGGGGGGGGGVWEMHTEKQMLRVIFWGGALENEIDLEKTPEIG